MLRQQISLTEIMNTSRSDASQFLENTEDTGLQEHTDENCLYCVCIQILGYQPNNKMNSSYNRTGLCSLWGCVIKLNENAGFYSFLSHGSLVLFLLKLILTNKLLMQLMVFLWTLVFSISGGLSLTSCLHAF